MRIFILIITSALVVLPALLIFLARHKPLRLRIIWGVSALALPFITTGLVQLFPQLTNNSADAIGSLRLVGVVLSGAGFVLPWVVFAFFLHKR